MFKKTVTYTDYNGVEKTESHYFGLSEAELTKMTLSEYGAMTDRMTAIANAKDSAKIAEEFDDLLRLSYGIKTPDGRFVKKQNGQPLFEVFQSTAAYDKIFVELCTKPAFASEFAKGIMPENLRKEAEKRIASGDIPDEVKSLLDAQPELTVLANA